VRLFRGQKNLIFAGTKRRRPRCVSAGSSNRTCHGLLFDQQHRAAARADGNEIVGRLS
jgi:hypothetical protein